MAQMHTSANGLPVASNVELVPTRHLPDRFRSVFPFAFFNALQSKSFHIAYGSSDNFVLSAPTGGGKTAILELAICRLLHTNANGPVSSKVVYQAPTKALCSERCRDWQAKFAQLNLKCEELTGDTESIHLRRVQSADILVTTPEKWDNITRRWSDHKRLMDLIKLFLIDEVHILKDDRGSCLEATVSRMKTLGNDVRFIALSATVPNSADIAKWLGKTACLPDSSATLEVFGEQFRPVRLEKHVLGLSSNARNEFMFEQICNQNLPLVIEKHSQQKPILIFCMTRSSTEKTAASLADWWASSSPRDRYWPSPQSQLLLSDENLLQCTTSGVAYHHAGLEPRDRVEIEQAYCRGNISVICCTSTLAVGVNLPCHLVVIKNTVFYHSDSKSCPEYSDLDVMQMLGRAGRPQFGKTAVAVIITRQEKVAKYEKMVQGQEILESRLHLNLIEHMNSEVSLRTIHDLRSACAWLKGTFLFVRLAQNPNHYSLEGDAPDLDSDSRAEQICSRALASLQQYDLVSLGTHYRATPTGEAMSKYSVSFETMKLIAQISAKAKLSELLSVIAQASEFKSIRFRASEKAVFRNINSSPMIRFPIKVNLDLGPQKVSLVIQATLGGLDPRNDDGYKSCHRQYSSDVATVFQAAQRLAKCIVDCQLSKMDAESVRNAMEMSRSLGARAWDDSPLQLAQIDKLGPVAVRKLVASNIKCIDDLECTEPYKIEMALSRNPPFGMDILEKLQSFPKLRVTLKSSGKPRAHNDAVRVQIKAELGFLNERPPLAFNKTPVSVCFLAETSDGRVLHFERMSGRALGSGQNVFFDAELLAAHQLVSGYVSCDDIAGTLRHATLDPQLPATLIAKLNSCKRSAGQSKPTLKPQVAVSARPVSTTSSDEFGRDLEDEDLTQVLDHGRLQNCIDAGTGVSSSGLMPTATSKKTLAGTGKVRTPTSGNQFAARPESKKPVDPDSSSHGTPCNLKSEWQPTRLANGNWKCNHRCKNKLTCGHKCCRDGTENKPKPPKAAGEKGESYQQSSIFLAMKQRQTAAAAIRPQDGTVSAASRDDGPIPSGSASGSKSLPRTELDFDDIDELPSDVWEDELAGQPSKTHSNPAQKYDRPLFITDSSSPAKGDASSLPQAWGDTADEMCHPDHPESSRRMKRAPEEALSPIAKRRPPLSLGQSQQHTKYASKDTSSTQARNRSASPLILSDVDFGAARQDDDGLFPGPSECMILSTGAFPAPQRATLSEVETSTVEGIVANSEVLHRHERAATDSGKSLKRKATLDEMDAFLMKELGHVANFV